MILIIDTNNINNIDDNKTNERRGGAAAGPRLRRAVGGHRKGTNVRTGSAPMGSLQF